MWKRWHCNPHKDKNRAGCASVPDFFFFFSYQEPGLWNIKSSHLGGLLLNKTVVKNSSDHQQNTVVTFYIALRHLFYGSVRLQFHNSYTAVQSLPTLLTILCVEPTYQYVSEDRSPEASQTVTCYRLWCTYLFVAIERGVCWTTQSSATIALVWS